MLGLSCQTLWGTVKVLSVSVWLLSSDKESFCLLLMGLHFRSLLYNKNQCVADGLRLLILSILLEN